MGYNEQLATKTDIKTRAGLEENNIFTGINTFTGTVEINNDNFSLSSDGNMKLDGILLVQNRDLINELNNVEEELDHVVRNEIVYTNSMPTLNAHGGIAQGTTFDNVPITEMLTKILYPYIEPIVSAKVTSPSNGGVYEIGGPNIIVRNIQVKIDKKTADIKEIKIYNGPECIATKTDGIKEGGIFDFEVYEDIGSSNNTTYVVKVTDATETIVSANTGTFTFVYPFYTGVCSSEDIINKELILSLNKIIETKGTKTISYTCNNQCMIFAYPKSYGTIKSIMDPNNFNVTDTFTKMEVEVFKSVPYYVYINNVSTVDNFNMKFSF